MAEAPSLTSLCMEAITKQILRGTGDYNLEYIYEIPSFLLDDLITRLPPLALHKLQEQLPCKSWWDSESAGDCFESSRKRAKFENVVVFDDTINENFNASWKRLFMSRWPDSIKHSTPADWVADRELQQCEFTNDWRQKYWEAHVQDCIDEAAERAMLPSFDGCIGEITISDAILEVIGISTRDYSKFCNHCEQFAKYARCMRLQNVFFSTEICKLLRGSKLQSLVLRRIKSDDHVDGLCKLLRQNCESLRTLEFIHCKLSSNVFNAICDSLHINGMQPHMVQNFSVKASSFLEKDMQSLPIGLISFLSSGRSLCSLTFLECRLGTNFAKMLFNALLDASSCVSILDLSENNLSGGLTYMAGQLPIFTSSHFALGETLQSLRVLNLRGNNLHKSDVDGLVCGLYHIPNLETLDLSDNPITDAGVRSLTSCFGDTSQRCSLLSILKIENCDLSCSGATQLLEVLLTLKKPLDSLSIADNELGSQVAPVLGKFMTESVKVLNIELIGLGPSGFVELEKAIGEEMKLVYLNISKNRGGIPTANCLSKIISRAPELVAVSAAYNFIPVESLTVICAALRIAKGKLEHLDLTGNERYELEYTSVMDEFQHNGRPIVIFPSSAPLNVPHDHDL